MKDTFIKLLSAFGPSGNENGINQVIREMINGKVDEIKEDALGNLIALKKGTEGNKKIMLAAHMDQIGFIVTDIENNGFIRVSNVGGIRRAVSTFRRVIFENGLLGVLALEDSDIKDDNDMQKLYVDIGAADYEQAKKLVSIGDMCVYYPDICSLQNNMIAAPATDDRVGCLVLVEMINRMQSVKNDIYFVFTVQEEVGLRGAKAAAYSIEPDVGISIDVTRTGDTIKPMHRMSVKVNDGAAIKIIDRSLISTQWVVKALQEAAGKAGAKWQPEVLTAGGNDAGAIQATKGGIPACTVSIPCRYVHSASEVVSLNDTDDAVKLLIQFVSDLT